MPPKKAPATGRTIEPSDLARIVGDICRLLEKLPAEHRQKALDTAKTLLTTRAPTGTTNVRPPQEALDDILRDINRRPQFAPGTARIT